MTIAPIPGGSGSGSVASPSTDTLTAEAAFQNALNQAKGTQALFPPDPYNVVKYSFDHGDAVQTDINADTADDRPQVEFTVDSRTHTATVTELNPNNGMPLIDPQTKMPYREVITETPSGSLRMSGNLRTQGFDVALVKAPPSVVPEAPSLVDEGYKIVDEDGYVNVSAGPSAPSVSILDSQNEYPPYAYGNNPYMSFHDRGDLTLNTSTSADKSEMTSSYIGDQDLFSDAQTDVSYFTSPPPPAPPKPPTPSLPYNSGVLFRYDPTK
jgi:hypothetical protein